MKMPAHVRKIAHLYRTAVANRKAAIKDRAGMIDYLCKSVVKDHPEVAPHIEEFRRIVEGA